MKNAAKRAVTYIASRLINGKDANSIYDYASGDYFPFSGSVSKANISVHDYTDNCTIAGFGTENSFSLFHYGTGKNISLEINDDQFKGYDYDSGKHFLGSVSETSIKLYDYEQGSYFHYKL